MSPVAAPAADKRFRRAHVKPGRKRRDWLDLLKRIFGYAVLAVAIVYSWRSFASPLVSSTPAPRR